MAKISLHEFENLLSNTVFRTWHEESEEKKEQEKYEKRCKKNNKYARPLQYPKRTKKQWLARLRSELRYKRFSKLEKSVEQRRRKALLDLLGHLEHTKE